MQNNCQTSITTGRPNDVTKSSSDYLSQKLLICDSVGHPVKFESDSNSQTNQ